VKSYSPWFLDFARLHDEGWIVVWGVEGQGCHLVRDVQALVLHIRISSGTGPRPDEVGWLFHRLS
jgi:hypothetical protein